MCILGGDVVVLKFGILLIFKQVASIQHSIEPFDRIRCARFLIFWDHVSSRPTFLWREWISATATGIPMKSISITIWTMRNDALWNAKRNNSLIRIIRLECIRDDELGCAITRLSICQLMRAFQIPHSGALQSAITVITDVVLVPFTMQV